MKRAAEEVSVEDLADAVERATKRARVDGGDSEPLTLPEELYTAEIVGKNGARLPMLISTYASALGARGLLPENVQRINGLWYAATLLAMQRPRDGDADMSSPDVYAPPLVILLRWLAFERQQTAFVAAPNVARWSPYNDDAFINAINEWHAMKQQHPGEDVVALYRRSKIPFIERNRSLWQNIYTVCVATLTAAHAFLTRYMIEKEDSQLDLDLAIDQEGLRVMALHIHAVGPTEQVRYADLIGPTSVALRGPDGRAGPSASILDGTACFDGQLHSHATLARSQPAPKWQSVPIRDTAVFQIEFSSLAIGGRDERDTVTTTRTYAQVLAEPEWTERTSGGNIVRFRLDPSKPLQYSKGRGLAGGQLLAQAGTLRVRYDRYDVWPWLAGLLTADPDMRFLPVYTLRRFNEDKKYDYFSWMIKRRASGMRVGFITRLFDTPLIDVFKITDIDRFICLCFGPMVTDYVDVRKRWDRHQNVEKYFARLGLTEWILPPDGGPVELLPGLTRRSHAMFARPVTS